MKLMANGHVKIYQAQKWQSRAHNSVKNNSNGNSWRYAQLGLVTNIYVKFQWNPSSGFGCEARTRSNGHKNDNQGPITLPKIIQAEIPDDMHN